jgi:hypothetical protein
MCCPSPGKQHLHPTYDESVLLCHFLCFEYDTPSKGSSGARLLLFCRSTRSKESELIIEIECISIALEQGFEEEIGFENVGYAQQEKKKCS